MLYIVWNPSEVAFSIGSFSVRWYSLCWLIGLALAYFIVKYLYKDQKIPKKHFDPLFIYCFFGILIGARLGHCLFYEPGYFLSSGTHILEMFVPLRQMADGSWKFTGYEGLASHGGTLGLMIALFLYYRKTKVNLWRVLDNIAIATPVTACFIRLGNLMNSEIIGKVTDVPWAFVFENAGHGFNDSPRHPGQLYEAIAYFIFFFIGWHFYKKAKRLDPNVHLYKTPQPSQKEGERPRNSSNKNTKTSTLNSKPSENTKPSTLNPQPSKESQTRLAVGSGFYFGLCLTLIFVARFFIEFTKENQVSFEDGMALDMGQLLSIPFIVIGVACMIGGKWLKKLGAEK